MFEKGILMGLFAETSLHPGTGSTTGVVDLPIQRERHTGYPIIQSTGLKGALREKGEKLWGKRSNEVNVIFGPENSDYAGSIATTDARLLAFPVRSLSQVYVWITCPDVVSRLKRDMDIIKCGNPLPDLDVKEGTAICIENSDLGTKLVLEEFSFDLVENTEIAALMKAITCLMPVKEAHKKAVEKMGKHLVVISNGDFAHLVNTATQVSARIKLNDKKTTTGDGGNLWYEESLPPDCLFYSMLFAMKPRGGNGNLENADDVLKTMQEAVNDYLQIGGNETVGMGWCAVTYCDGGVK